MLPNYNMSTFEVFLSFSFLFHFYIHKTIHPWSSMRKTFLCTPTFLYMTNFFYTRIRTLSLYVTWSIYEPYLRSKIFHFSQHTPMVYTKVSLYTLVAHTHKDFFSHIIYTRKNPSIHIFLLHLYMRNIFLFLYISVDIYSQRFFLFIMILVHFLILDDVPK